jgi:hypothetical protein
MTEKLSEAELAKLIGRITPRPGAGKPSGPNFVPRPVEVAAPGRTGIAALPTNPVTNPEGIMRARMAAQGMACGGKVKKHAGGGKVRGCGAATKGHTKGKVC